MSIELGLMLVAVFVAYFLSATFGFGDALILLPILSLFIDIKIGIIFTGFWGFPQAIQQIIKYRNSIDKKFLLFFVSASIPGIFLGIWLILYLESVWIQITISIIILVYSSKNLIEIYQNIEQKANHISDYWLIGGGFSYGTISSWVGTPGPVSILFLEYTGHYRENFIANNSAIVFVAGIFKLSLYLINGLFPSDNLFLFIGGLILCFIATKLGHHLTPKISIGNFQIILNALLLIVGMKMLISNILLLL